MTSLTDPASNASNARLNSVQLQVAVAIPTHGAGALNDRPVRVEQRTHATSGATALAVLHVTAELAVDKALSVTVDQDPTLVVMPLTTAWSDAENQLQRLIGGRDVTITVRGDDGGTITWEIRVSGSICSVVMIADAGIWYSETLEALPKAAVAVLAQATESARQFSLATLDGFDRAKWLADSRGPRRNGTNTCLLEEVRRASMQDPERIAVRDADTDLSYAGLLAGADKVASLLIRSGATPGNLIALDLPRGTQLVTAMLGAWRARCAFVALDPSDSATRRARILEEAQPILILGEYAGDSEDGIPRLRFHEFVPTKVPELCCQAGDNAYVMFTSGSTGAPKGATVAHAGLLNHVVAKVEDLGITETDVVAQTGPISFDILVWQCVAPLIRGARVEVVPDDEVRDVRLILHALDRSGATVWQALPAIIRAALEASENKPTLELLRWIVPTGDALPSDLCRDWLETYPNIPLLNTYGSTECSDDQCHHVITSVQPSDPPTMLLGRPIAGMTVLVMDRHGKIVPPGVPGELFIGGVGVGPGYWRRSDLTAQRFATHPELESEGRLYRSGDLGRRRPDGTLEFLGRIDETVKIRGRRVDVSAIEGVLRSHPSITDCAVVDRREVNTTDSQLIAFVVAPDGVPEDLRTHIVRALDEHHVPDAFRGMGNLPLSINGKIDRSLLRSLDVPIRGSGPESLSSATERRVASLFEEVLGVRNVGKDDNFFVLGGHSLAVGRLLSRVAAELGADLPLHALYDYPTPGLLSAAIEAPVPVASARREIVIRDRSAGPNNIPLTDLQQAYWVGETEFLGGGGLRAHVWLELKTAGLEARRLESAFDRVVAQHEVLQTFIRDGELHRCTDLASFEVETVQLDDSVSGARQLDEIRNHYRDNGPDTGTWPLFEATLVEHDRLQRLFLSVSLLVADAATEALLIRDLLRAYAGEPLAEPASVSYAAVARAVTSAQSEPDQEDLAHWTLKSEEDPGAPALPYTNPAGTRPEVFTRRSWALNDQAWRDFGRNARAHGITPTAALFTVYADVLGHWSASPRFTITTLASLRLAVGPDTDNLAGNLSTTIPTRFDLTERRSFVERAMELQKALASNLEHARTSGIALSRRIARTHGWSEIGLSPIVFASTLDVINPSSADLPLPARVVQSGVQTPHVHLDHQIYDYGGRLLSVFDSLDGLFEADVVANIVAAHEQVVRRLATTPRAWTELVPLVSSADQSAIPSSSMAATNASLHAEFVAQARTKPDAIAIRNFTGDTISYSELLRRSQIVARVLHARGVGKGDLIAHVMQRGWEQIAAILGTSIIGAAYLPIDAAVPDDRIRYLLSQATSSVVLTQSPSIRRLRSVGAEPIDVSNSSTHPDSTEACHVPNVEVSPSDLAYVIYTSGSTGTPKGVAINHSGAMNTIRDVNSRIALRATDVVLGLSSTSFDLSVWDIFGTLSTGASLVLLDPNEYRDPAHWHDMIVRNHVTVWNSVPALLELYVSYLENTSSPRSTEQLLRQAMLSGDWIPVSLPDRAKRLMPGLAVLGMGGATEASIWSIAFPIEHVDPTWRSIPYGLAMANQGVHILDLELSERPIWVVGEIYISGAGVARGYWRDPALTKQRFVVDKKSGARLYRTGDLGRRRPDGVIEFLGRADTQVKIQGHRVELGEIEATLILRPEVEAAAVTVFETPEDGRALAAYVVLNSVESPVAHLRAYLASTLPAYMIPAHLIEIDQLPLTRNGKVDRSALPAPIANAHDASPDRVGEPIDQVTQAILEEVRTVLGRVGLGPDDSFFDHGGNSFAAMRLVGRLRSRIGVDLRLSRVFEAPTARLLGTELLDQNRSNRDQLVIFRGSGSRTPLFLAHPVGGAVSGYQDVIRALHPERAVYGIQATIQSSASGFDGLVQQYASVVEDVEPEGPVALGGWSMGGVLAHALAHELRRRGRTVAAVMIVDSESSFDAAPRPSSEVVAAFLTDLSAGRSPSGLEVRAMLAVKAGENDSSSVRELVEAGIVPEGVDATVLRERLEIFETNLAMLQGHIVAPCGSQCTTPLVVAFANGSHLDHRKTRDGWREVCPSAAALEVQGDHYSVIRNGAAVQIAEELERRLDPAPGGTVEHLPGGVLIRDDYRWMESDESALHRWFDHQGKRTSEWLSGRSDRPKVHAEMQELFDGNAELTQAQPGGPDIFALLRRAGDLTACLVRFAGGVAEPTLILDPAKLAPALYAALGPRSHVSIDWFTPSPSGNRVAVGLSVDGSEDASLVVIDRHGQVTMDSVVTRAYPMRVNRATTGGVSWHQDEHALAYLRLQDIGGGPATAKYQHASACIRMLDEPSVERVVARAGEDGLAPDDLPLLTLVGQNKAMLTVAHASARERSVFATNDIMSDDLPRWRTLARPRDRVHGWCVLDEYWYAARALDNGWEVVRLPLEASATFEMSKRPQTIATGRGTAIEDLSIAEGRLVARLLRDGAGELLVIDPAGAREPRSIRLPARHGVAAVIPVAGGTQALLTSWVEPSRLVHIDLNTGATTPGWSPTLREAGAECRLVHVRASDGQTIPVTLISTARAADASPSGKPKPTWLTAYGFFGITLRPNYTPLFEAWLAHGGTVAIAHVRGGGDKGDKWYRDGHREHTARSISDLVEVSEWLTTSGLTTPDQIILEGTSAGGLTVGGAVLARPMGFAAAILRVSLTNTLRLEMHENGPPNIPEYGSITTAEGVEALMQSEVYGRVESDRTYPPFLLTVGLKDPRVQPWQPAKLAARLQEKDPDAAIVRVEEFGGHGIGASSSQVVSEAADRLLFALTVLERNSQ